MKAIKRTIAALLATLMLATSTSFSFAAESVSDDDARTISKVNASKIMTGTENGFEAEKTLTRAEAAAIIVRMKGIPESQVKSAAGTTLFTDVPATHWAAGYINAASTMNLIKGVGNGNFAPDKEVTIAEFTTMAVRALGAGVLVDSQGTWPTNYMNFAGEEKLTDGVFNVYTAAATRMNAANIVANTIEAPVWEKSQATSTNEVTYSKSAEYRTNDGKIVPAKTILNSVLNITEYENVFVTDMKTKDRKLSITKSTKDDDATKYDYILSNKDVADGIDMNTLKESSEYDVWYNTDTKEIVRIDKAEDSKLDEVEFTEIVKVKSNKVTLRVNGDEKEYTLKDGRTISYNGNDLHATSNDGKLAVDKDAFGTVVLDGSKIVKMYIEKYERYGVVKEIKNGKIRFKSNSDIEGTTNAKTLDMEDDDVEYIVTKDGKDIKIDDVKEGDALFFYEVAGNGDKLKVLVNTNIVEGEVSSKSSTYVRIDGKKYNYEGLHENDFSTESTVKAYLNEAGYVVMFEEVEAGNSNFAIVKSLEAITNKKDEITAEVVLVGMDGTEMDAKEVDLEEMAEEYLKDFKKDFVKLTVVASDAGVGEVAVGDMSALKGISGTTFTANDVVYKFKDYYYKEDQIEDLMLKLMFGQEVKSASSINKEDRDGKIVGELVQYENIGNKVIISKFATANDEDIKAVSATDVKVGKVTRFGDYYLNDSTKAFVIKDETTATKNKYSVKVNLISIDELDTSADSSITGFVGNIDEDSNEVGIVVLNDSEKLKRETNERFAMILSKEEYTKDDYDYAYEVIFQGDDEVKTLYADKTTAKKLKAKHVYELVVSGDEITDVNQNDESGAGSDKLSTVDNTSSYDGFYITEFSGNDTFNYVEIKHDKDGKVITYTNEKAAGEKLVLADEVMYVEYDDDEYRVTNKISELVYDDLTDLKDEGDVKTITYSAANTKYEDALDIIEDASKITSIVTYQDKDGVVEVVAIIYNK